MDETVYQSDDERRSAQDASSDTPELEGYQFIELIGQGTFGDVWLATQERTGQRVAVKMLRPDSGLDWRYLEGELARLRALGEHPNVVTLLDADLQSAAPFFVMPHLTGGSLQDKVGQASEEEVKEWLEQAASALAFSHERGLLHCDIKPSNILLDADKRLRLVDFGQSTAMEDEAEPQLGTLGFMPPEQVREGARPSTSWDIYAIGATMYQLLTGLPPRMPEGYSERFRGFSTVQERLDEYAKMLETRLTPIWELRPDLDPGLGAIVMACLRRDPALRTASARTILEDLKRHRDDLPLEAHRPWKKSYLLERWFFRNRTVALIGLAVWCVVSMPVLWRASDFEVVNMPDEEIPAYELPADWMVELPPPRDIVLSPPLPADAAFDVNGDGTHDWKDEGWVYSQSVTHRPDRSFLTGEPLGRLLNKHAQVLEQLESWDSALGGNHELDWAPLGLLAATRAAETGEAERALRLGVGVLLLEINHSRSLWAVGASGERPMAGALNALDFLENFNYETVRPELLDEVAERLARLKYPDLAAVLSRRRDALVERLEASPTLNLEEPPVLTFFRKPVIELFKESWNVRMHRVIKMSDFSPFEVFENREASTSQYFLHPVKSGAIYLLDRAVPWKSFCDNKLYLDTRWWGYQIRLALERYRKDNRNYPDTLAELVPHYLKAVPQDPLSYGDDFIYLNNELWSFGAGPNRNSRDDIDSVYTQFGRWKPRLAPFCIREASRS